MDELDVVQFFDLIEAKLDQLEGKIDELIKSTKQRETENGINLQQVPKGEK